MVDSGKELASQWTTLMGMEAMGVGRIHERRALEVALLRRVLGSLEADHSPYSYPSAPPEVWDTDSSVLQHLARIEPDAAVLRSCREWVSAVSETEAANMRRLSGAMWAVRTCSLLQSDHESDPTTLTPEEAEMVDDGAMALVQFLRARWGISEEPPTSVRAQRSFVYHHAQAPQNACPVGYRRA